MCACDYSDVTWRRLRRRECRREYASSSSNSPWIVPIYEPTTAETDFQGYKEMCSTQKRDLSKRHYHRGCDKQFSSQSSRSYLRSSSPSSSSPSENSSPVCSVCDGRTCNNRCRVIEERMNPEVSKTSTKHPNRTSSSSSTMWSWNSRLFCLPNWFYLILLLTSLLRIAESCSSRSTPKPQQPSSTMRPNMTFHTYACPPEYAAWYCLNGATCFSLTLAESILYNCECADGYIGQRCEYKDLDQSYLPSRDQVIVETASIAGGITVAVLLIVIISISIAVYYRRRSKMKPAMMVEIREGDVELRPFRSRASFSSSIRMSSMVYSSNEPESGHKTISNSKIEQPNSTSA